MARATTPRSFRRERSNDQSPTWPLASPSDGLVDEVTYLISKSHLHAACHQARTVGDVTELRAVISAALDDQPVY